VCLWLLAYEGLVISSCWHEVSGAASLYLDIRRHLLSHGEDEALPADHCQV
jgi:hypothetical protein